MKITSLLATLIILISGTACGSLPTLEVASTPSTEATVPNPTPPVEVTYIKGGNVYLWKQDTNVSTPYSFDGNAQAVTISNTGALIVYLRAGALYFVKPGIDTQSKVLVSHSYLQALLPAGYSDYHIHQFEILPDGHTVYFSVTTNSGSGGNDLFKIDSNSPLPVKVLGPGQGGNFHFSPDGHCYALARSNELLLLCDDDSKKTVLSFPPTCGFGAGNGPEIVWKSDSSGFYIVTPSITADTNQILARQDYWFITKAGQTQLKTFFFSWLFDPTYISPEGSQVAYLVSSGKSTTLHTVNLQGVDNPYISFPEGEIGFMGWNPDSTRIVFWLMNDAIPRLAQPNDFPLPLLTEQASLYALDDGTGTAIPNPVPVINGLRWMDNTTFLFEGNAGLYLEQLKGSISTIDAGADWIGIGPGPSFDFPHNP